MSREILFLITKALLCFMLLICFESASTVQAKSLALGIKRSMPPLSKLSTLVSHRASRIAQKQNFFSPKVAAAASKKSSEPGEDLDGSDIEGNQGDPTISTHTFGVRNYLWSYIITIGVGHPRQDFDMMLDSGSSVLWVPSIKCDNTTCPSSGSINLFDESKSDSFVKEEGNDFFLNYGSGDCDGSVGVDSIFIGDQEIKNQKFGIATKVTEGLLTDGVNGILGFGPGLTSQVFNKKNEVWQTPFGKLLQNGDIDYNMFSVYFDDLDNEEEFSKSNGQLILGGLPDPSKYTGKLQYTGMYEEGVYKYYWGVKSSGFSVNGKQFKGEYKGIVDTGTSMIIIAPRHGKRIIDSLKVVKYDAENKLYIVDCKQSATLPVITFHVDGVDLPLPPARYVVPAWQATYWDVEDGYCPLYISTDTYDEFDFILGQKFLEHYVTVYDIGKKKIGFASSLSDKA